MMKKTTLLTLLLLLCGLATVKAQSDPTFTPITSLSDLTTGWYQIKLGEGNGAHQTNGTYDHATLTGQYMISKETNGHNFGVKADAGAEIISYIHVTKNGNNCQFLSAYGKYADVYAQPTATATNIAVEMSSEGQFKLGGTWMGWINGSNHFVGRSSGDSDARFQLSNITSHVEENYDVYTVTFTGSTGTPTLTYNKAGYTGNATVINNGRIFVAKGTELTAADFTASPITGYDAAVDFTTTPGTITVTYTKNTEGMFLDLKAEYETFKALNDAAQYFRVPAATMATVTSLDWNVTGTETIYNEYNSILTACKTAALENTDLSGLTLLLKNKSRTGKYVHANATSASAGTLTSNTDAHDLTNVFTFQHQTGDTYKLFNKATGLYAKGLNINTNTNISLTSNVAEAAIYTVEASTYPGYIRLKNENSSDNYDYMHMADHGGVVRWDAGSEPSQFYIAFADQTAMETELLAEANAMLSQSGKIGYPKSTTDEYTALDNAIKAVSYKDLGPALKAYKAVTDEAKLRMPTNEDGKVYAIVNAGPWNTALPRAMYSHSSDLRWSTFQGISSAYLWKFVTESANLMQNVGDSKYVKAKNSTGNEGADDAFVMTATESEATPVVFEALGQGQFNLKYTVEAGTTEDAHTQGHSEGAGTESKIVTWDGGINSYSAWCIEAYDVYTLTITGEPVTDATTLRHTASNVTATNGGCFYLPEGETFAENGSDFTPEHIANYVTEVVVDNDAKTIAVTYTYNLKGDLQYEYDLAAEVLAKTGVGYPAEGSTARTNLSAAMEEARTLLNGSEAITTEHITSLTTAINNYKATTTDIQLPEDGKAYAFINVSKGNVKRYINGAAGTLVAVPEDLNDLPNTARFIARKLSDGKYVFVNNEGKYLKRNGTTDSYTNPDNDFVIGKLDKNNVVATGGGNNSFVDVELKDLFGLCYMKVYRDSDRPNACVIVRSSDGGYDNSNEPYFNDSYSSGFMIEEVTDFRREVSFTEMTTEANDNKTYYVATYSAPYPSVLPTGVKAYAVTSTNETEATTWSLQGDDTENGLAIPANKGVLLAAETPVTAQYLVPATTETIQTLPTSENLLKPTPYTVTDENNTTAFILADGELGIGFYLASTGTIGSFRAYLDLSGVGGEVRSLSIKFGGEATGIDGVAQPANVGGTVYDLTGRAVAKPVKGGLYIKNGVKFIQK